MKNHKIGDKFVIEIDKIFEQDGETLYRAKGMKSLVFDEYGLNILTPMSHMHYSASEDARTAGQEEAWELAQKIILPQSQGGMNDEDYKGLFGSSLVEACIANHTYSEVIAKIAEWERKKEEICVGDVVRFKENNRIEFCVIDILDNSFLYGISAEGGIYTDRDIKLFEKTGRHIDVDAWMAQIGGDCNG